MFTGIIEEVGAVESIKNANQSATIRIKCYEVLAGTRVGDSIAVNGVCLTATEVGADGFSADVMEETVRRSSLATLRSGSRVNLERAMPADGRFGGHIVAGHVDGTGTIRDVKHGEMAVVYRISADATLLRYIVEKGSIAIDGISLTVAGVYADGFSVSIIPHTIAQTTLSDRRIGDIVNLETDIVGKYVEKLLTSPSETAGGRLAGEPGDAERFLRENGF